MIHADETVIQVLKEEGRSPTSESHMWVYLRLEDYIHHLLTVLPERLGANPDADIDDLLPWADSMRNRFGTGDH